MIDIQLTPPNELAVYLDYFWIKEAEVSAHPFATEIIIPNNSIDLIFNFGSHYHFQDLSHSPLYKMERGAYLIGHRSQSMLIRPGASVKMIAVKFKSFGLHPFTPFNLANMTDKVVAAKAYFPDCFDQLEKAIFQTKNAFDAVELLVGYFHRLLAKPIQTPDFFTMQLVDEIVQKCDTEKLKTIMLAKRTNYKTLERRFVSHVGLPPKKTLQIYRFNLAITALLNQPKTDYHSLALASGYYDKSHFFREFKSFTGTLPSHFVREKRTLCCVRK